MASAALQATVQVKPAFASISNRQSQQKPLVHTIKISLIQEVVRGLQVAPTRGQGLVREMMQASVFISKYRKCKGVIVYGRQIIPRIQG